MLISPRHLVDRLRHPRSRADELAWLRARFAAQPSRWSASTQQRQLAQTVRQLKRELSEALAGVRSCSGCAEGHPLPAGRWRGGHCCGGATERVFTPDEVLVLKLGSSAPRTMRSPRRLQAGCVFRGPEGCSLDPEDRPSICVRYICLELRGELRHQPRWKRIAELSRRLDTLTRELVALSRD